MVTGLVECRVCPLPFALWGWDVPRHLYKWLGRSADALLCPQRMQDHLVAPCTLVFNLCRLLWLAQGLLCMLSLLCDKEGSPILKYLGPLIK